LLILGSDRNFIDDCFMVPLVSGGGMISPEQITPTYSIARR